MRKRKTPMYDSGNLYIMLNGVDMQLEAWGLARLFSDENRIVFIKESYPADTPYGSMAITLSLSEINSSSHIGACLYEGINDSGSLQNALTGKNVPSDTENYDITASDLSKPGGELFKSIKIICGTTLYRLLSKAFKKELPYGSLLGVRPVKLAAKCLDDGLDEADSAAFLEKVTAMSREKARTLIKVAVCEKSHSDGNGKKINVYIGIPFCVSRCLYCSFTSHPIGKMLNTVKPYMDALVRELEFGVQLIEKNRFEVNSIYLGGGTPTSLPIEEFSRLLSRIKEYFLMDAHEFTVEAGRPDTIDGEKLKIIKESGADRISINPQSMNSETLALIGRNHTPGEIVNKFNLARESGFNNINMDIIAGLPGETIDMFAHTLEQVEELRPDSLTVHTMSIKRASRLKYDRESYKLADDALVAAMIEAAGNSAVRMGMNPYYLYRQKNILANLENTGYALPDKECDYNIQTMAEKQGIMAFGAGAVSKAVSEDGKLIRRDDNVKDISLYIRDIDEMIARKRRLFEDH